jgi:uridine kinase
MRNGTRAELLDELFSMIGSVTTPHPLRVAVDGRPASGKTTLADELAAMLRASGRPVVRACVDDFLWPRARRYRRGVFSPEGNYYDSFDYESLHRVLLDPLGPGGDGRYQDLIYDRATDAVVSPPAMTAAPNAVLLFDGVFLLRPELISRWELRIHVSASFERTLDRARTRDLARLGSTAEIERYFNARYGPSQQLYASLVRPTDRADVIVHNDVPEQPSWEIRARQAR